MILRVLAWIAVLFGGVITLESTLVAHRPNVIWAGLLVPERVNESETGSFRI